MKSDRTRSISRYERMVGEALGALSMALIMSDDRAAWEKVEGAHALLREAVTGLAMTRRARA